MNISCASMIVNYNRYKLYDRIFFNKCSCNNIISKIRNKQIKKGAFHNKKSPTS